ncbi:hypothetical protein [Aliterella atlantica]|uniref:hypothetical protein n=1 Tax=Aliterella atlantica TaxID=1827278 RepID=UPI0005D39451|nr:hypothetical protein [Aliterella atlantica]
MCLVFLIPLTIGLVTGYVFKNCVADMAELLILAIVFNLILSLVLAPWQLQLVVLVLVLVGSKQILPARDCRHKSEENNNMRMF